MTIICSVAAEFENSEGGKYSVTSKECGVIKEAPEWIKDTLLFHWLVKDGSIKFVTKSNRITAENDPMAGLNAEGKIDHGDDVDELIDGKESETEGVGEVEPPKAKRKYNRKKKDDAE